MLQNACFVGEISTKQGYHGSGAVYVQNMSGALAAVQLFRILSTAARLLALCDLLCPGSHLNVRRCPCALALMSGRCPQMCRRSGFTVQWVNPCNI